MPLAERGRPRDGLRILSVEDDALNRALLRATLARSHDARLADAMLVEAPTVADAREALASSEFHVVLLDRRLPDGDGFQLATELHAASPRPRIVALTADAVPETRDAALRAGCDEMLTKPYEPQALLEVLAAQVDAAAETVSG